MTWRLHSKGWLYEANESTVVYFDSYSGDTHLLSEFAGFLMKKLSHQVLSTEELVTLISPSINSEEIADLEGVVISALEELVFLDILKRD